MLRAAKNKVLYPCKTPIKSSGWSLFFLLFIFLIDAFSAQNNYTFLSIKDFKNNNTLRLDNWKYQIGHQAKNALPQTDDSKWDTISTVLDLEEIDREILKGEIWFRYHIQIDSSLLHTPMFLLMYQYGASEIYLDGELLTGYGTPSETSQNEKTFYSIRSPFIFSFKEKGDHVFAIRYSNHHAATYNTFFNFQFGGFNFYLGQLNKEYGETFGKSGLIYFSFVAVFGFLLALSLLHFLIYLFYKEQRSNLFYSLFTLCFAIVIFSFERNSNSTNPLTLIVCNYYRWRLIVLLFIILLRLVYTIVYTEIPKKLNNYTNILIAIVIAVLFLIPGLNDIIVYATILISITSACTVIGALISKATKRKQESIKIIGRGFQLFIYFSGIYYLIDLIINISIDPNSASGILIICLLIAGILSVPVSMSVYLALNFAKTNKYLQLKLKQVENLSAKTLEQERERKKLIESQKDELEIQVKLRTAEVVAQKEELGIKNKEIIDSITYAKRLQEAILPPSDYINSLLPENFVLYIPKDIIAGDFFWIHQSENRVFIAAADSTGHGVPGAMVSIVCSNALDKAVKEFKLNTSGEILDKTTDIILEQFAKSGEEIKDGMDISLLCFDKENRKVFWSGANNPLWYIYNNELTEIKADKQPVGKSDHRKNFTTHEVNYKEGTTFYLMTDGFADQFGGPNEKKFKYKQLSELLISNQVQSMSVQKEKLKQSFETWKGDHEQVDDVCIIGIQL